MVNFRLRMTSVSQILSESKAPDAEEGQSDAMGAWPKQKPHPLDELNIQNCIQGIYIYKKTQHLINDWRRV